MPYILRSTSYIEMSVVSITNEQFIKAIEKLYDMTTRSLSTLYNVTDPSVKINPVPDTSILLGVWLNEHPNEIPNFFKFCKEENVTIIENKVLTDLLQNHSLSHLNQQEILKFLNDFNENMGSKKLSVICYTFIGLLNFMHDHHPIAAGMVIHMKKMGLLHIDDDMINKLLDYDAAISNVKLVNTIIKKEVFVDSQPKGVNIVPHENKLNKLQNDHECKVCLDKRSNCVIMECGHICCCLDCSGGLKNCPICRGVVTKIQKIYFA